MTFSALLTLGAIAGFVTSKAMNNGGEGRLLDIISGGVGALVGELISQTMSRTHGVSALGVCAAVAGTIVVLLLYHAVRSDE